MQFDDIVFEAGGTSRLIIDTGGATGIYHAMYWSGSGTNTLTFRYNVQAYDDSADLDYTHETALEFNGSTIKDATGNNAVLTLATPGDPDSLSDNKNIVVFTTPPALNGWATPITPSNAYVEVRFTVACYNTTGGTGALETGDFNLTFNQNGGAATGATMTGITDTAGLPLSGGETQVRILLNILNGPCTGLEFVVVTPANGNCIFNAVGIPMLNTESETIPLNP